MSDPDAPAWGVNDNDAPPPGELGEATAELLALARKVHGSAWADRLSAALGAAVAAQWPWKRRLQESLALVGSPAGDPKTLADAVSKPTWRKPAEPGTELRGAELARQLVAERCGPAAEAFARHEAEKTDRPLGRTA